MVTDHWSANLLRARLRNSVVYNGATNVHLKNGQLTCHVVIACPTVCKLINCRARVVKVVLGWSMLFCGGQGRARLVNVVIW